jgi:hypothetical protein
MLPASVAGWPRRSPRRPTNEFKVCRVKKHVTDLGSALAASNSSISAELTVVSYPDYLLTYAQHLADSGTPNLPELPENLNFGLAVVLAHTACEVAASRVYWSSWRARDPTNPDHPNLAEWQTYRGHNLANEKFRKQFKKVTGKDVSRISLWDSFAASSDVRQKVIHATHRATASEVNDALEAAREMVRQLQS